METPTGTSEAQQPTLSVAVLPFETTGLGDGASVLGDGIPERTAEILTRQPFFDVASVAASFRFRGDLPPLDVIAGELGVRYVLHGNVRGAGSAVRVSARVADCATGRDSMSTSRTEEVSDLFVLQDEIALTLALEVESALLGWSSGRPRSRSNELEWYQEFNRGKEAYLRFRQESNRIARRHYLAALQLEPDVPVVLASLAFTHATDAHFGWSSDRDASLSEAARLADRALAIDPECAHALSARGHAHLLAGEYDEAIELAGAGMRGSFEIGPHIQAMNMLYTGRFSEAASLEREAIDLLPFDAITDNSRAILATALVHLGDFHGAVEVADQCLLRNPTWLVARVARAVALAGLGDVDAAQDEGRRILRIAPRFTTAWWGSVNPYRSDEHRREILDPLARIGLPEQPGEGALEPLAFPSRAEASAISGRWLVTVLLSDVVDSTGLASQMGDRQWRETIGDHDARARRTVEQHGGRVVKTTGDGVLAIFDTPSEAVAASIELRASMAQAGLEIRAGVHTGEIEVTEEDVHGIGVHIAARVSHLARPNEILVTSTVKDLVAGSGTSFASEGSRELRGVPDRWELFSVEE